MGFIGVYRALYDYSPQAAGELALEDGDLLYIIEKGHDDGWWKAKKKAGTEDEEEPIGLIPHNYVEIAPTLGRARALYEYTRQTDEELSFHEDTILDVFDTSDPDWILVGHENEFGFVPSNYIEVDDSGDARQSDISPQVPPALPQRSPSVHDTPQSPVEPASLASAPSGPAAVLAGVISGGSAPSHSHHATPPSLPQPTGTASEYDDYHHASDEDASARSPALPSRPRPHAEMPDRSRTNPPRSSTPAEADSAYRAPGGFHMYNVNEMVSVMGKRKKMPTTLGINLRTGMILIAPERAEDGPTQEWSADRMTHYSREGKHVFVELVRPSKSVDFHAGAKDTAEEIVAALGEMAGAVRAEGLREVIMAGTNQSVNKGVVLYDFMAQGDDEVTVAAGDEVIIVDDSKSEEWWQVRRLKSGKEGVVPSSYIEVTGSISPPPGGSGIDGIKAAVEQNRAEEIRLTKEALRASKESSNVGPGMSLPTRGSSLAAGDQGEPAGGQRSRRGDGRETKSSKSKPDSSKVRTWTDRSKSFSVDAQFLGLKDGKIHLHKMNGVKIAVPIAKMSREDLEYVENMTGISLQDEKTQTDSKKSRAADKPLSDTNTAVNKSKKPEYDWFQFFLDCDVAVGLCERYAQAFIKDSMDESVLPDVNDSILRTLGLREGDIIKVMRTLDTKFDRQRPKDGDGGLFSGPGGALRNNTRKGRPAPAVQTSDVVDAAVLSGKDQPTSVAAEDRIESPAPASPRKANPSASRQSPNGGFEDDAWDVKPAKDRHVPPAKSPSPPPAKPVRAPAGSGLTGSMKELSLLSEPLQPTKAEVASQAVSASSSSPTSATQQPPGANPAFFSSLTQPQQTMLSGVTATPTGPRQRPTPAQISPSPGSLAPPPPQRPLSAPQSAQASAFSAPALIPQMTGGIQTQVAPAGQSLNEINQARLQQQQQQQQQQYVAEMQKAAFSGYQAQPPQGLMSYQPGNVMQNGQFMQPMMSGLANQSPFADPGRMSSFSPLSMQPTGFQANYPPQQSYNMAQGGVNSYLPAALEPQRTAMAGSQNQQLGLGNFGQQPPPQPPLPQQPLQPLLPQQTGPAPPVRFGVAPEAKKLAPQPTGRRANLSQATPQNPFGF